MFSLSLTCVLLLVARQSMHMAADLLPQAVNDVIKSLRAAGLHADEELVLLSVHPGRTGLNVGQVDAIILSDHRTFTKKNSPTQWQ